MFPRILNSIQQSLPGTFASSKLFTEEKEPEGCDAANYGPDHNSLAHLFSEYLG